MTDRPELPSTPRRLTIREIETISIRVPLVRTYRGSQYQMTHRSTTICRVHTEEGIVGEAWAGDEDASLGEIARIIDEEIAPGLIGEDGYAVERSWQLARPATFNILRDRRLGLVACACVDAAIWDAIGKALGQPLWRLWGGYQVGAADDLDRRLLRSPEIAEEIAGLRELGLAGFKFKVGGRDPRTDAERFKRARAAAGDDFILCADANQAWTADEAIEFVRLVEDPDLAGSRSPAGGTPTGLASRRAHEDRGPVCAGQSEHSASGCRELMEAGAIDVCNFDASWSGGPTEWRRAAAIALELRPGDGPSRGATGGRPPDRLDPARHLRRVLPSGPRPDLVEHDREPPAASRRAAAAADRPGSAGSSTETTSTLPRQRPRDEQPRWPRSVLRRDEAVRRRHGRRRRSRPRDRDGEFMVFVGPSGCGKSTALRMVAGLEASDVGRDPDRRQGRQRPRPGDRDVAMVFQNYALYPHMTVRDNIGFPLRMQKLAKEERRAADRERGRAARLEELLERKPARSPAGSASAWRWAAPSSATRRRS